MSDPSGDTLQVSCKLLVLFISLLQSTIEDSTPSNFNQTLNESSDFPKNLQHF